MVVTALSVDGLFRWAGLAPLPGTGSGFADRHYFAWDYTAFLNVIFVPLGLALFWIGHRAGGDGQDHR